MFWGVGEEVWGQVKESVCADVLVLVYIAISASFFMLCD